MGRAASTLSAMSLRISRVHGQLSSMYDIMDMMSASGLTSARYTRLMNIDTAYGKSSHIWGRSLQMVQRLSGPRNAQGSVLLNRNLPSSVRTR